MTFSISEREKEHIAEWQKEAELWIKNLLVHSLSLFVHPVYLAAAYLELSKMNLIVNKPALKGRFPDFITGSPWFHFVDPKIYKIELETVSENLK